MMVFEQSIRCPVDARPFVGPRFTRPKASPASDRKAVRTLAGKFPRPHPADPTFPETDIGPPGFARSLVPPLSGTSGKSPPSPRWSVCRRGAGATKLPGTRPNTRAPAAAGLPFHEKARPSFGSGANGTLGGKTSEWGTHSSFSAACRSGPSFAVRRYMITFCRKGPFAFVNFGTDIRGFPGPGPTSGKKSGIHP